MDAAYLRDYDDGDLGDMAEEGDYICPYCSGSGEGMHDGTKCSMCGGSGGEPKESFEDRMDRADREMDAARDAVREW